MIVLFFFFFGFFFFLKLTDSSLRKFNLIEINLVIGKYEAEQIGSLFVIFIVFCMNNRLGIICEIVAFFFNDILRVF